MGMSWKCRVTGVVALCLLAAGCASKRGGLMTGRALVEVDDAFAQADAKNSDAAADFWTEDAAIYLPDVAPVYGKKAVVETWASRRAAWTPCCAGVDEGGSIGYTLGEGPVPGGNESTPPRKGRYVAIWRKDEGRWRCALQCWTPAP